MRNRTTVRMPLEEAVRNAKQKATVLTGSDVFEIKRETKQGDPLSRLLFNTVLQVALKG